MDIQITLDPWNIKIDVDVEINYFGDYYPATRETPAEYPDVEWNIISTWINGNRLYQLKPENFGRIYDYVEFELEKRGII